MNELKFYEDLLGLPELKLLSIEKSPTRFIFYCEYTKRISDCPVCPNSTTKTNQTNQYKFRNLKISKREVYLYINVPQFFFPTCNRYFFNNPDWVMSGKSYTKRQAKWGFELSEKQFLTQVAALVDVSHKTVERLFYSIPEQIIGFVKESKNLN